MNSTFWNGKRVLVTGATGFLGGWLARRLLENGAEVWCIIRERAHPSQFAAAGFPHGQVKVLTGDIADDRIIESVFQQPLPFDAVFHLASLSDVNAALDRPLDLFRSTVDSTISILEQVRMKSPQTTVIVASSDKAYGAQEVPFREDMPLLPSHPYEIAKAVQDKIARFYGKHHRLNTAITRCGNYFGPWDFSFNRIIPQTIRDLVQGRVPTLRSDGKSTRDFLYIEDAVDANLLLAERVAGDAGLRGEAFNFSHELGVEMLQLVTGLCQKLKPGVKPAILSIAKVEIQHMRLDCAKAKRLLGWTPRHTFEDALDITVKWYLENLKP